MIGEIGGDAEERAAAFIEQHVTKPVVGYVAGFTAPEGKTMGHAGAIISGSAGTAQAKKEALEKAGVRVGQDPQRNGGPGPRHHAHGLAVLLGSVAAGPRSVVRRRGGGLALR